MHTYIHTYTLIDLFSAHPQRERERERQRERERGEILANVTMFKSIWDVCLKDALSWVCVASVWWLRTSAVCI